MFGGEPDEPHETPGEEFAKGHYEQLVAGTGTIRVGDEEWEVDGFGLRDHSWGPRYWQAPWYYRWLTANVGRDFGFMGSRVAATRRPTAHAAASSGRTASSTLRRRSRSTTDVRGRRELPRDASRPCCDHRDLTRSGGSPGEVMNLIPLRNRRPDPDGNMLVTRISEGMTEWTLDDGRSRLRPVASTSTRSSTASRSASPNSGGRSLRAHVARHVRSPRPRRQRRSCARLFVYLFLVIALRLAGKRELAQLSTFDFVVLLSVANAVQNGIIGNDDSITGAWIGAMTLFVANFALAFTIVRSRSLRRAAEGEPAKLMEGGVVNDDELRKVRITHAELESAVGANGEHLSDVEAVELFPNGRISITPRDPDRLERIENELHEIRSAARSPMITFHLVPSPVWDAQRDGDVYVPEAFAADGFVHCTDGEQAVIDTANRYYQGDRAAVRRAQHRHRRAHGARALRGPEPHLSPRLRADRDRGSDARARGRA